jgi:23S rRNA (uracil1939-C5)-methyltransferase
VTVQQDEIVELAIEKPAAGGRMLARHEGQVVLVQGGIPGERVRARIGRVERQLAFAETVEVLEPSGDRRQSAMDPACGGCLYAHIDYDRQRLLKAELVRDAFRRLGRITIDLPAVAPSPERGYRMRARLHVRGDRIGFYREGTHELCDAAATGQMDDGALAAAARAVESLAAAHVRLSAVELTENIAADERVLHVLPAEGSVLSDRAVDDAMAAGGLTGCTGQSAGVSRTSGVPVVTDPLSVLTGGAAVDGSLQRHVESFFQANRYLLPDLVKTVMAAIPPDGAVLDLYAGVGLFSVCLAACGRSRLTAIEGDRTSGRDLSRNAAAYPNALRVAVASVEDHLLKRRPKAATILVDPPRTGMSREALQAIIAVGATRIVYVSCDPATMARDARRLLDGGYELTSLEAFDLFPNTPHVETLGVFVRAAAKAGVAG